MDINTHANTRWIYKQIEENFNPSNAIIFQTSFMNNSVQYSLITFSTKAPF